MFESVAIAKQGRTADDAALVRLDNAEVGRFIRSEIIGVYDELLHIGIVAPPFFARYNVAMASSERFGYEWDNYDSNVPEYENKFRGWIAPLGPGDFRGKDVLDVGCGMGRNSYWALSYDAKSLTAIDADVRSVAAARRTLAEFKNAHVELSSIYDFNAQEQFDIVFCIGVLHHLEDPRDALVRMVAALRPGGTLAVWVYGYEGNEWIVRFVDPVRKHITSKLPLPLVHFLTYFCSVPLYLFVRLFRGPSAYLEQLSRTPFWYIHTTVFDQLIPSVAHYWKKGEVETLFSGLGLSQVDIHAPENKSGWIIIARK